MQAIEPDAQDGALKLVAAVNTLKKASVEPESAQHSALPWTHQQLSHQDFPRIKSGNVVTAHCTSDANARLIVRSVNNAEKLAEACKRMLEAYAPKRDQFPAEDLHSAVNAATTALAQWEAAQ